MSEPAGGHPYKRPAYAITELVANINAIAPHRSTEHDGILGDQRHAAEHSGHNPNGDGIVCADDATHDPTHGADMHKISEDIRQSRDERVLYCIFNGRIYSGPTGSQPFVWRPYKPPPGGSMHTDHMHMSVRQERRYYDDRSPWAIGVDMPLSDADLAKIKGVCEDVWAEKNFVAPGEVKATGPTYRDSALRNIWAIVFRVEKKIDSWIKAHP